jgi:flavin reductase (DIM6/NTAB) family NADH-FMN oxidoreductase RutF
MPNDAFDELVGRLDPPLVIVTAVADDLRSGCLVGFHSQCSIDPRRSAIWLSKANHTYRVALFAEHLAVHLLDRRDRDLAELFGGTTGDDLDPFTRCAWTASDHGGVPLLTRCPNRFVLRTVSRFDDGSDHVCFVGDVVDASSAGTPTPLRVSDAADIDPGHPAEQRPVPDDVAIVPTRSSSGLR